MKFCPDCGDARPRSAFNRNGDGLYTYCREHGNARQRAYSARPEVAACRAARHRFDRYGLSEAQYVELLRQQEGRCAACRIELDRGSHVDHDHVTGRVRGILCRPCNLALGHVKEDPERLRRLAVYVEGSRMTRMPNFCSDTRLNEWYSGQFRSEVKG